MAKMYSVSLTLSVEGENEEKAAAQFIRLVETGAWDWASIDSEEEILETCPHCEIDTVNGVCPKCKFGS
jgi:hypothetical protein